MPLWFNNVMSLLKTINENLMHFTLSTFYLQHNKDYFCVKTHTEQYGSCIRINNKIMKLIKNCLSFQHLNITDTNFTKRKQKTDSNNFLLGRSNFKLQKQKEETEVYEPAVRLCTVKVIITIYIVFLKIIRKFRL